MGRRKSPFPRRSLVALALVVALMPMASACGRAVDGFGGPGTTTAGCTPPYALSAAPATGPAPLLVTFSLSGPIAASTVLSWSFGDGEGLNGTGPDYGFAVHSYPGPGTFGAVVTVDPSAPTAVCSATVSVQPGPIIVAFISTVYSGPAPLTAQFTGTASGGTGDYRSELWSFGDGASGSGFDATHTFVGSGPYRVVLTVADSAGVQGNAEREITILPPGAGTGPTAGGASGPDLAGWAVLLGGVAVAGGAVGLAYFARRHRTVPFESVLPSGGRPSPTVPSPLRPDVGPLPPMARPSGELGALTSPTGPVAEGRAAPAHFRGAPTGPAGNALQTSQRVILHLARQGTPPPAPLGLRSLTQAGIGEALHLEQSNLARVLQRLERAGVVTRELRHVPGVARRSRIYLLTPSGYRIATGLIRHETRLTGSSPH